MRSGSITPEDLPRIQVVVHNEGLFSVDNRRLMAFSTANIEEIPIEIVSMEHDAKLAERFYDRLNPIAKEGNYIVVVNSKGRREAQELLYEHGLISGVQLGR